MAQENQKDVMDDLSAAATAIFGGTSNEVYIKSLDRVATIKPASMKQLPILIGFFKNLMAHMDQEAIASLVELISDKQRDAINRGEDPSKLPIEEIAGISVVNTAFKNASLLTILLSATFESLPKVVPAFTTVTEQEYGDLSPDEGLLLAGGVFMANYGFFTQSLPPLLTVFFREWASKNTPVLVQNQKRVAKTK